MADEKHLYMTVRGVYDDPSDNPEGWQFGVRLALVFGSVDDIGTLPNNWDVAADNQSSTDGDWDYVGLWTADGPGANDFDPTSWLHDYGVPSVLAFLDTDAFSTQVLCTEIKLAPKDHLGKTIQARTAVATANTDVPGSHAGAVLPLQDSVVVSLRTGTPGPRGRGRFYLPTLPTAFMGSHGRLDSSVPPTIATAAKAFLEGLVYSSPSGAGAHTRTIVTGSPWVNYSAITQVKVGDLVDTQRRRRRQLDEAYSSEDVDY